MFSASWVHLLELEPFSCSVCLMNDFYLYPVCVKLAPSQYLFLTVDASVLPISRGCVVLRVKIAPNLGNCVYLGTRSLVNNTIMQFRATFHFFYDLNLNLLCQWYTLVCWKQYGG